MPAQQSDMQSFDAKLCQDHSHAITRAHGTNSVAYVSEATPYSPSYNTHPPVSYNTRQPFPPYIQQIRWLKVSWMACAKSIAEPAV